MLQEVAAGNPKGPDQIALLERLNDLGVIWETVDDRWEMGVPSFGRYVLRRHAPPQPCPPAVGDAG